MKKIGGGNLFVEVDKSAEKLLKNANFPQFKVQGLTPHNRLYTSNGNDKKQTVIIYTRGNTNNLRKARCHRLQKNNP